MAEVYRNEIVLRDDMSDAELHASLKDLAKALTKLIGLCLLSGRRTSLTPAIQMLHASCAQAENASINWDGPPVIQPVQPVFTRPQ